MNQKWNQASLETGPHDWRRAFHRGWVDGQNDPNHWPKEYDRMNQNEQIAYECGRLWAVGIVSSGLAVPRWDGGKATCRPVNEVRAKVTALAGDPVPHFDRTVQLGEAAVRRVAA